VQGNNLKVTRMEFKKNSNSRTNVSDYEKKNRNKRKEYFDDRTDSV
jgi:hypothetical protein